MLGTPSAPYMHVGGPHDFARSANSWGTLAAAGWGLQGVLEGPGARQGVIRIQTVLGERCALTREESRRTPVTAQGPSRTHSPPTSGPLSHPRTCPDQAAGAADVIGEKGSARQSLQTLPVQQLHRPAGQLGPVLPVETHSRAVGRAVIPGRRGVFRAAEIAQVVIAAVGETHERIHVRGALRAADQSRGSVEKRDRGFLRMLQVKRRNRRNRLGEGGHEDGAWEFRFVEHVVGLRENAHGGSHVARTADSRVLERVLVRGERQRLRLRGSGETHADPVVVFLPAVGAKGRVFFGVRDSVQIDQVVRIARFLRLASKKQG